MSIKPCVKEKVAERDSIDGHPCCVYCGSVNGQPNAHYIARSQGGLGIEENILTLCPECHRRYDNSIDRVKMRKFFKAYLIEKYPDWDETKLIYRKEMQNGD